MTHDEQETIVLDIFACMQCRILAKIPAMSSTWDRHELHEYIAREFDLDGMNALGLSRKRRRDFYQSIIDRGL
jgi:hypothetical protein